MTNEAREKLTEKLQTLDKETGIGIFPDLARKVNDGTRFLIISYGGTGADVLNELKKGLKKDVVPEDYAKRIRLLAIDTDKTTRTYKETMTDDAGQKVVREVERFESKEFFYLDNEPALHAIKHSLGSMQPWVNPKLVDTILGDKKFLDGNGASSTRQIGRILLSPQQTVTGLETKINQLVSELTDDNDNALKVLIISGISGGTGSGVVIDDSYLIRYFISKMSAVKDRVQYCGFILLPPTGVSKNPVDIAKGNRNGYAALKEIDHFMTIGYRKEVYRQQFGTTSVVSANNIFDTCYLIDGQIKNVALSNPRERAKEVIRDCILDMITSLPVDKATITTASVDSFMSDAIAYSMKMVGTQREEVAPRDANYVYCAVGHGKALIPLSLMKAFVAANVYKKVYGLFRYCDNVSPADIETFIEKTVPKGGASPQEIRARIEDAIRFYFTHVDQRARKGGPFFTINLFNGAVGRLTAKINELNQRGLVLDRQGHQRKIDSYVFARNYIVNTRDQIFTVYVELMEQMRKYFDRESEILTDSHKYEDYAGTTYTFSPIDFTKSDDKTEIVRKYLDKLINGSRVDKLASELVGDMIQKRDEWTQLVTPMGSGKEPKFDGANLIRSFWETRIGMIVDATVEDYLIKYYSGDESARYAEDDKGNPTPKADEALKLAAKEIVSRMLGGTGSSAVPLAALREDLIPADNFNGKSFILVPQAAPHLKDYIEQEIKNIKKEKTTYQVLLSTANDRISCYAQYSGIPAFIFTWTLGAEKDYEQSLKSADPGLHMSETKGGKLWRNYPNLIPENIWSKMEFPAYTCLREKAIDDSTRDVFLRSVALGLGRIHALATTTDFGSYEMEYIDPKSGYGLDEGFFKSIDNEFEHSPVWEEAVSGLEKQTNEQAERLVDLTDWEKEEALAKEDVFKKLNELLPNAFASFGLDYTNTVLTAYTDDITPKPQNWEEELGADLLRQSPEYTTLLRSTVLVLEKFYEKVTKIQSKKLALQHFADYLAYGFLQYDEKYLTWSYKDEDGVEKDLLELNFGDTEQKTAEFYFLFERYMKHADAIDKALAGEVADYVSRDGKDKEERLELQKKLLEQRNALVAALEPKLTADKTAEDQSMILVSSQFRKKAETKGWNVDDIIALHRNLKTIVENGLMSK